MGIITALNHITHYKYDSQITLHPQTIRLKPAPHSRSLIKSYSLNIFPQEHFINWQQDPFGNYLARIIFLKKTEEFKVEVDLITEIQVFNPFDFFINEEVKKYPFKYEESLKEELLPYIEVKESGPFLKKFLSELPLKKEAVLDFIIDCNQKLSKHITYAIRLEAGVQSCEETLITKKGSCRDMAWLLIQIFRHCGIAARFASGYLIQLKQDLISLDSPSGPENDFSDLHAWTEVYIPGAGWIGLDPTSGLLTGEGHIPLCCTPNPSNAAPITGSLDECSSTMTHEMQITRINEDRRVTKPYTDLEWKKIQELGDQVEESLENNDVRLTMGGEPTFVSLNDPEGEEWSYTALSENKFTLGKELLLRWRETISPNSIVQYSQGKWYPGEPLPRWAIHNFSRKDNEPLWEDDSLFADPTKKAGHTLETAERFMLELAKTLGISSEYILSAREDSPYYLWKEQSLPIEGEIYKASLYEKNERLRLQKLLEEGLNSAVGYVLPLKYSLKQEDWISELWKFRSGHLVLTIGDSPIGLRLPLLSLPDVNPKAEEIIPERSPFEKLDPLPKSNDLKNKIKKRAKQKFCKKTALSKTKKSVRSALCIQVRLGQLYIFLPPLSYFEHFLDLIVSIESVSKKLNIPIVLEGYEAPKDHRINHFSVTPDPGVLEVNMQPSSNWRKLTFLTTTLYECAERTYLTTQKFLLDGRAVGTGGGNHIVVGGSSVEDSPFLRRPDLLRSMLTFWQNHPSLSYLFSTQYIGPTSQSPRIDEARHDSLYELEIAFQQIPKGKKVPKWLVDRLFRNLLIDLTGNTHRAEFCIDKLFSPDSERGRLGLLELRGFEMTPHPHMNLLQALLIRAVIAKFWKTPYEKSFIRWGTLLHDKFMLPEFIWSDFCDLLKTFNQEGLEFSFDPSWFEPFMEFRFPKFGSVQVGPVSIELRYALESWPILGEEMFNGGVSRAVDSSVERLQVKVTGFIENRHILTCNGYHLPLMPTGTRGVFVCGIRYKAWAPCSSLHPTIPVHSPLVFDLVDSYHNHSIGGCKYHVIHPGGRNYDKIPVNSNEAEGRRHSRFQSMTHSPGKIKVHKPQIHADFPYTLDLRACSVI